MHAVFQGVFRDLLQRISATFTASKTADFDNRLRNVHVPLEVSRTLRPLADFTKGNWRVSELRTVAYLAPLLFRGLLPQAQYDNLILFCTAMYYLHSTSVSAADLQKCERQIKRFSRQLLTVYKDQSIYTYNVHLLLHLPYKVQQAGPLYTHSCDEFESFFGKMLSVQHGTRGAADQILRYFSVRSVLDRTSLHLAITNKPLSDLCSRIMSTYSNIHVKSVGLHTTLLGKSTLKPFQRLSPDCPMQSTDDRRLVECYRKCVFDGHMYKVSNVCRETKRVDCYLYIRRKFYILQDIMFVDNTVLFLCNRLHVCRLRSVVNTAQLELRYPLCKVCATRPTVHYFEVKRAFTKCCSVQLNTEVYLLPLPTLHHRS
jgi:hypothetical protein